jgi:hypothetical protein
MSSAVLQHGLHAQIVHGACPEEHENEKGTHNPFAARLPDKQTPAGPGRPLKCVAVQGTGVIVAMT